MINNVVLCGKAITKPELSHTFNEVNFYKFDICFTRTSGNKDIVQCVVREIANFNIGDWLCVTGKIVSRKDEHLENFVQVATIEPIEAYNSNKVEIEGYVVTEPLFFDRLKHGKKICKCLLAYNTSKKSYYIPIFCYGVYAEILKNCKKGDVVKGIGKLETRHIDKLDSNRTVTEVCLTKLEVMDDELE